MDSPILHGQRSTQRLHIDQNEDKKLGERLVCLVKADFIGHSASADGDAMSAAVLLPSSGNDLHQRKEEIII